MTDASEENAERNCSRKLTLSPPVHAGGFFFWAIPGESVAGTIAEMSALFYRAAFRTGDLGAVPSLRWPPAQCPGGTGRALNLCRPRADG
jgi:hypothetical protein